MKDWMHSNSTPIGIHGLTFGAHLSSLALELINNLQVMQMFHQPLSGFGRIAVSISIKFFFVGKKRDGLTVT